MVWVKGQKWEWKKMEVAENGRKAKCGVVRMCYWSADVSLSTLST